ncbi:hypothetical protein NIES2109_34970 [Nostoc sp. HK-01]|nr:hypothetical protein NIES2109_34970 [Nostoc sp. HK-01]
MEESLQSTILLKQISIENKISTLLEGESILIDPIDAILSLSKTFTLYTISPLHSASTDNICA